MKNGLIKLVCKAGANPEKAMKTVVGIVVKAPELLPLVVIGAVGYGVYKLICREKKACDAAP